MRRFVVVALTVFLGSSVLLRAQNPCDLLSNKKQNAAINAILGNKITLEEKIERLLEKSEELQDNPQYQFKLGELQYNLAEKQDQPDYSGAKKSLEKAKELCDKINPVCNYYLGIICYSQGDLGDALSYFKTFAAVEKNSEDKKHEERLFDVQQSIPSIEKEYKQKGRKFEAFELVQPSEVKNINTTMSEYLPMLSPDNGWMYFTRKFQKNIRGEVTPVDVEELSIAKRLSDEFVFDEGVALKYPFNLGGNYGGVTLSINNKEMYVTLCIPMENGYKNCDIYYTKYVKEKLDSGKIGFKWLELKKLGEQINSPTTWEAQPSLSPDGNTLYFTRYGKETKETDLYCSVKDSSGNWQTAIEFPGLVNGVGHDKAPFIHQDGKTLYFASSGRKETEGGFDIYYSVKTDSSWSIPKNVGMPVNTVGDEHGMLVSTDGRYAVFAANGGQSGLAPYDLFYVELPQKSRPEDILLLKGTIENSTLETHLQLKNEDGEVVRDIAVDADDGGYATVLKKTEIKKPLILGLNQQGAVFEARIIDSTRAVNGIVDNGNMAVNTIAADQPYTINDINFETNSAVVKRESLVMLNEFARFLMQNPAYKVMISGHTDNIGSEESNKLLSLNRALSVKEYLVSRGVPSNRLSHQGFGDNSPREPNTKESGRAKNRRTEFILSQ